MTAGQRPPHLADALAVEQWADRVEARTDFPRLVRRLIRQTNDQVVSLEMRAGEGAGFSGYDGQVEASRGTPFVPRGASVWELGVGGSPENKANEDYAKRTADPLGVDKSKTTFVFVTARRWAGRTVWAAAKRADKKWADVQAFDADDIETAFDAAPAAQFWFSELIGLPVDGVRTIENWWDAFSRSTQPNLTLELILAGRADQAAELLRILEEDTRVTTVSAASTDDVLAFVAATLLSSPEPTRGDLLARTLIVYDAGSLRRLEATTDLLVLLPFEDDLVARPSSSDRIMWSSSRPKTCRVTSRSRASTATASPPRSPRPASKRSAQRRLARAAYRSLVAFQAETPSRGAPVRAWSSALHSKVVRRAWLAGGWQDARSGDTDALELLFGMPYDDARAELSPYASGEDPVFAVVGGTWGLTSAEQAWQFGNSHLTAADLTASKIGDADGPRLPSIPRSSCRSTSAGWPASTERPVSTLPICGEAWRRPWQSAAHLARPGRSAEAVRQRNGPPRLSGSFSVERTRTRAATFGPR